MLNLSESRETRHYVSAYVAVYGIVLAVAGIASGLLGGAIAQALGGWRATVLGVPLTYHGILFILSSLLRFSAVLWLLKLEDTGAAGPRAALQFMSREIYSNIVAVVFIPGRLVAHATRWTYKLNRRSQRPPAKPKA